MSEPRGVRNKNPGNLRWNPRIAWAGEADPAYDADGYCVFQDDFNGIRALCRDLKSKWNRGLRSVRKIIEVYAPPSENNTVAYAQDVSDRLGVNPDDLIDLSNAGQLQVFAHAVILHECGKCPFSDALIAQAVRAALT